MQNLRSLASLEVNLGLFVDNAATYIIKLPFNLRKYLSITGEIIKDNIDLV